MHLYVRSLYSFTLPISSHRVSKRERASREEDLNIKTPLNAYKEREKTKNESSTKNREKPKEKKRRNEKKLKPEKEWLNRAWIICVCMCLVIIVILSFVVCLLCEFCSARASLDEQQEPSLFQSVFLSLKPLCCFSFLYILLCLSLIQRGVLC